HGGGEFDVPHPLATHPAVGHLHPTAVADHPLVLHAAVLAAGAFPVLLWAKDPLAEQTVLLRTIGPVVNRLGLLDFPKRPTPNVVRPRQADLHRSVVVNAIEVGSFKETHSHRSWGRI